MLYTEEYQSKLVSADEAVKIVKSGDWIDYGFGHSKPIALDNALAARKDELKDINIRHVLSISPQACIEADPEGEVFTLNSWHFSGYDRKLHDRGRAFYNPLMFRNQALYYQKSIHDQVDVVMFRVTKMNKDGFFNLHCACASGRATLEAAKKVIVEVNEKLPWAMGGADEVVHISEVDYIVEAESNVEVIPAASPSETDKKIAEHIVPLIPNGACIQLGIGGLPNFAGTMLVESDIKDLGCHSEMLVDAFYHLHEAGKLTNRKKGVDKGKSTFAFAAGSQFLYDWLNYNPSLVTYPASYTNNPWIIAQNPNTISINACIEVDLFGQISSESSGTRHISGTGGQLDFATGAYMSEGGISFICCNASYKDKNGNLKSCIVPTLPPGSIVTVPRSQAHCIVTEYGIADLAGRSSWQRAEALINIAHPDLRDELIKDAEKMNIWRKRNRY
ncbi:MAG TPA: acetyl-CoA hydrolase/transferase C-terminal domain-containing protein [Syntrophomonadaceae bacterium]|nr:acetyl-CoA hydrolase/transferase C-terminal domain-containing protein [Syntrophomonadaceae bacterium]